MRGSCALLATLILAAGCAQLLPKAEQQVASPWTSFEAARDAFEQIQPDSTTASDLRARGFDPFASANVQLLSFSDVLLKFPLADGSHVLDAGLKRCLESGKHCTGYSVNVQDVHHDRTGNFMLDLLGFKRVVDTHGWTFNGLILLVDDRVVYTLYGGQPRVATKDTQVQPLGPVQSLGDATSLMK